VAEFPSGFSIIVCSSTVSEQGIPDVIRGHHATLFIGGNKVELKPERPFSEEIDQETFDNLTPVEDIGVHEANWFSCIRTNKLPNANIELAIRTQTVISLGEASDRLGIACHFDEKARKITDGSGKEVPAPYYGVIEPS